MTPTGGRDRRETGNQQRCWRATALAAYGGTSPVAALRGEERIGAAPVHSTAVTTPLLVINGSIGAGKTTVLGELAWLLEDQGIHHCAVDFDALTQSYPRPDDDPFHMRLGAANLAAIWVNASAGGAERLVVASVVETAEHLSMIVAAVSDATPIVVRLRAPLETELNRIRQREQGSALEWHLQRASDLWPLLENSGVDDAIVDTVDKEPRYIADEVLRLAAWQ